MCEFLLAAREIKSAAFNATILVRGLLQILAFYFSWWQLIVSTVIQSTIKLFFALDLRDAYLFWSIDVWFVHIPNCSASKIIIHGCLQNVSNIIWTNHMQSLVLSNFHWIIGLLSWLRWNGNKQLRRLNAAKARPQSRENFNRFNGTLKKNLLAKQVRRIFCPPLTLGCK